MKITVEVLDEGGRKVVFSPKLNDNEHYDAVLTALDDLESAVRRAQSTENNPGWWDSQHALVEDQPA